MALVAAHGLSASPPRGWEVRIFRPPGSEATLHAGSFALPARDGEYGAAATTSMSADDAFVALTEFRADGRLAPGLGLFSAPQPRALAPDAFSPHALQHARPGQLGLQVFFSAHARAFCLYAVLGSRQTRTRRLTELNVLLRSVRIDPRDRRAAADARRGR